MELQGKNILVVGLGISGAAAARFCAARGAAVTVNDARPAEELAAQLEQLAPLGVQARLGGHPSALFTASDLIILSPGVPANIEPLRQARDAGVPVLAEVELAGRFLSDRIIGITGSNGKSTTTALTAHLLRAAGLDAVACGNIGCALIDLVGSSSPERFLAVELSSFQLETIERFRPDVATVLNITPDHMDRYADFEAYLQAKLRLLANQTAGDLAVVNFDEEHAERIAGTTNARIVHYSLERELEGGVFLAKGLITSSLSGSAIPILPAAEMTIPGPHNLANALAATAIALLCGAQPERVAEGLRRFRGLEHRLEPVAQIGGVSFVNDSKATNVDAAGVALRSFAKPIVAIMGGRDKAGDFAPLRALVSANVRELVLVGEAADKIGQALDGCAPRRRADSMRDAVRCAFEAARPGDVVLLAPACTSFDWYSSFEERGRDFKQWVRRLADE